MADNYIYPTISSLPRGYGCTVIVPLNALISRLIDGTGHIVLTKKCFYEGENIEKQNYNYIFETGNLISGDDDVITADDRSEEFGGKPGFMELSFRSVDESKIFTTKRVIGYYSIYTADGKKSFLSDNAYKFGDPQLISQIALFGRYIIGYPVIRINKKRNIADTLCLINPYNRAVVARIKTSDKHQLGGTKVAPLSATYLHLSELLKSEEDAWSGQIQLTANNRLVTYILKHRFNDVENVTDHEHLDPFRSDPTHLPATLRARQFIGSFLKR